MFEEVIVAEVPVPVGVPVFIGATITVGAATIYIYDL